jgi:hypothetical protein
MKSVYLTFAVALVASIATVGCGKSQNDQPQSAAVVSSAAAPVPGSVSIPTGCYYNPNAATTGTNCAPCPQGYTLNGTSCMIAANGAGGCTPTWNGYSYACNTPTGFGTCPSSGAWGSYSGYGCYTPSNYGYNTGYYCAQRGYAYVCYYTNGAPAAGYYFNGYGWVRSY